MTKPYSFQKKLEKRYIPEPNSGCWIWLGYVNHFGYGETNLKVDGQKQHLLAHRLVWRELRGEIPDGLHVCHHCDNPSCVNPDHLFLGTPADNMADMVRKGRWGGPRNLPGGKDHARAMRKLTDDDVLKIRRDKRPQAIIANDYGVHPSSISNVLNRKSFTYI